MSTNKGTIHSCYVCGWKDPKRQHGTDGYVHYNIPICEQCMASYVYDRRAERLAAKAIVFLDPPVISKKEAEPFIKWNF